MGSLADTFGNSQGDKKAVKHKWKLRGSKAFCFSKKKKEEKLTVKIAKVMVNPPHLTAAHANGPKAFKPHLTHIKKTANNLYMQFPCGHLFTFNPLAFESFSLSLAFPA